MPKSWAYHLNRKAQFLIDFFVLCTSFLLAYLLRFDFQIPDSYIGSMWRQLPLVVALQAVCLGWHGIYSFIWRYVGMAEVMSFVWAGLASFTPLLMMRVYLPDDLSDWRIPLSVLIMDLLMAFGGVLGVRVVRRAAYERFERKTPKRMDETRPDRTIFVGAGQAGILAAREISRQPSSDLEVVGFVDDDPNKQGSVIHGLKVLGSSKNLEHLVHEYRIDQVVITMARAPREILRELYRECRRIGVKARIMPAVYEILEGRLNVSRFRQVQIEDILGREAVKLQEDAIRDAITGNCVVVTGAGGSIGAELARQAARFSPSTLVLIERSEPALFEADRDLRKLWPTLDIRPILADVRDSARIAEVFRCCGASMVLHAAAHKHVPLVEANPKEALANNALGAWELGRLAAEQGVERFVLISTDKAVRPTSVMGTTKRIAELFVQELDRRHPDTHFVAVRFGNVLGSTGSVVPIFREQIESGGPVTVTHPDMVRYFMTIPEAAQLVLQAGVIGEGGEIFLLDMGEPVKIVELARDMIRLAGLEPDKDVEIVFSGVRPGEKLFEELGYGGEELCKTKHPKIFVGRLEPYESARIEDAVVRLEGLVKGGDEVALRRYLAELVPEATLEGLDERPEAAVGPRTGRSESGERIVGV